MSHRSDATWTPLDAAAARLGISRDAARKRLERGTLRGEKRDGRWLVLLDTPDAVSTEAGRQPTGHQDAARTPLDATTDMARELIDQLKSENAFLRDQLEQVNRERTAERERFDIIHREALNRIEALTAGVIAEPSERAPQAAGAPFETPMPDDPFTANGAAETPAGLTDELNAQWSDLTDQLIAELAMDPEAALIAAAADLGIPYDAATG